MMLARSPTGLITRLERPAACSLLNARLSHSQVRLGTGATLSAGSSTPHGGVELTTAFHKGGIRAADSRRPGAGPVFKPRPAGAAANGQLNTRIPTLPRIAHSTENHKGIGICS